VCILSLFLRFSRRMHDKWKALLLTLTCDILSLFCWMRAEHIRLVQGIELTYEETLEKQRRKMLYMFYLLRAPLWDEATKPFLNMLTKLFDGVPLLNGAVRYVVAFLQHSQSRHSHSERV
jgi:hypothetical protein